LKGVEFKNDPLRAFDYAEKYTALLAIEKADALLEALEQPKAERGGYA
jgi:hypothetical protein